ncbi:DUF1877 family protein [Crocosphaera chwakensis]|uniref:DUF1877 family protein n=1 Tax=Crocosphaera chwakensis CCY0110 TaxID=391612 RepID=A3IK37_9CHRO|nr:DUF1877 family protein [Crocosphaera chwakensis]EAZ93026.1 hypothetical protein CY0110_03119 [Crocosphaera chwakensis CCY0110]
MGITFKYRRISLEYFEYSQCHPFGLDIEDFDELISFYDNLRCSDDFLDIGKDWQALHLLLTGEVATDKSQALSPLGNVVFGGIETEYESTYSKVRCLNSNEIIEIVKAMKDISTNDLISRFDPNTFNTTKIYPNPQPGGWDIEQLETVLLSYEKLKSFFKEAAEKDQLIFISPC